MFRFGNQPIDIGPLIHAAENAVYFTSLLPPAEQVEDSGIPGELFNDLSLFGRNILGKAGLLVAFGDHVIGNDHNGTHTINGSPVALTGRYQGISSVYVDASVEVGGGATTNVVPAMDLEITNIPITDKQEYTLTTARFSRLAIPLLGQKPLVYEYVKVF